MRYNPAQGSQGAVQIEPNHQHVQYRDRVARHRRRFGAAWLEPAARLAGPRGGGAMTIAIAETIVAILGAYLGVGAIFAVAFVTLGLSRIDPAAHAMPLGARLLIWPGVAALWPLMLQKWLTQRKPPVT